jgi:hypothetical protein
MRHPNKFLNLDWSNLFKERFVLADVLSFGGLAQTSKQKYANNAKQTDARTRKKEVVNVTRRKEQRICVSRHRPDFFHHKP